MCILRDIVGTSVGTVCTRHYWCDLNILCSYTCISVSCNSSCLFLQCSTGKLMMGDGRCFPQRWRRMLQGSWKRQWLQEARGKPVKVDHLPCGSFSNPFSQGHLNTWVGFASHPCWLLSVPWHHSKYHRPEDKHWMQLDGEAEGCQRENCHGPRVALPPVTRSRSATS
jgi:hypothetical protein